MSLLQSNAIPLNDSSEVFISGKTSEVVNSLDIVNSGGSINIIGSVSGSSLNLSNNISLLQIKKELKDSLISEFSKLKIDNNKLFLTFYSIDEISKIDIWKDKIYKIRKMKKDKNSFVRNIIFCILENIILNNNIISMKEFIIKYNEISELQNKEKTKHILLIILDYLEQNNKTLDAYNILLKAFLYFNEFDYCLNFYVRKLIYNFISINQNNSLNDEQPNKISELLPEKYNQDKNGNTQILDNFYKDLINMDYEIPLNEIYSKVIPYIFKDDLNIIEYNSDKKEDNIKLIKYKFKENNKSCLNLIYLIKEKNFNIYYAKDFYEKFNTYLKIINDKICIKCKNIYNSKKNLYKICDKCLLDEINDYIYRSYLDFRINNEIEDLIYLTKNNTKKIIDYMKKKPFESGFIKENDKTLGEIIIINEFDILELIQKVIKKTCLVCYREIDNKNNKNIFTLPCKCNLCSSACLEKYIKSIEEKNETVIFKNEEVILPMCQCYCGYCYKLKDFNKLKKIIEKINKEDYLKTINEAIENNIKWKCFLCEKNFNKTNIFLNLKLKDENNTHLLCENCRKVIGLNIDEEKKTDDLIELYCIFCEKKHNVKSWEIAKENNCIIL